MHAPQLGRDVPQLFATNSLGGSAQLPQRRRQRTVTAQAVTAEAPQTVVHKQPYGRVYNFAAGPACLPLPVLEQAQAELLNWQGSGCSVMEMSHRGKAFTQIIKQAESDLRALLDIPDNYKVMFLQGGGTSQFSAVPLNLTQQGETVDYIVTGSWSKKAAEEAQAYGLKVNVAAKGDMASVPDRQSWNLSSDARYVCYCDNETIQGVEFKSSPEVGETLLVADMSSNFLSKPVDVSKYGLIFAGAQKNIGPAGVVIVIARDDLLGKSRQETPTVMDYKTMQDSLHNTPPCWSIYMCGLVFSHMLANGGVEAYARTNRGKAQVLYSAIDNSNGFYHSPVARTDRSNMNVPFTIPRSQDLEKEFIAQATKLGLTELKGHRSVGGMRASIYNSMPAEGIESLVSFMKDFASQHA